MSTEVTPRAESRKSAADAKGCARPRIEGEREGEILDATLEMLVTNGYDRLTMDSVATAARASKATLYRRWDSKADLVVDALTRAKGMPAFETVDTGSLRGDLFEIACTHGGIGDERVVTMMASIITALHHDDEFAAAFQERFLAPKMALSREVYERARRRGEIGDDVDLDILNTTLAAIVLHRAFVLRLPVDDAVVLRIIDQVVIPAASGCRHGPSDAHPTSTPTHARTD